MVSPISHRSFPKESSFSYHPAGLFFCTSAQENVTPDPVLYVQSALLYTNSEGERRIRVHTWAAMTTPNFNDIIGSIDVQVRVEKKP